MKLLIITASLLIFTAITASAEEKSSLFKPDGSNFYVYNTGQKSYILNQNKINELNINQQISKLSSGKKIINASDDPAGSAVAEKMEALLKQMWQESMNAEDIRNFYNLVDTAISEDQELLQRIRQLTVQASNGILNTDDRKKIQAEIDQLLKQVNLNAKFLHFNNISIIPDLTAENIGVAEIDVVNNHQSAINLADKALTKLNYKRVIQGIKSNVLKFRIEGINYQYINFRRAESNISDTDMADGITKLINSSVLLKTRYGIIIKSE